MAGGEEIMEFAESLRGLKDRSGRSYGALAARLHVSTSTLHRYCNGDAVPGEYAAVERFARLCGATPEELIALHRRWILADAARRSPSARGGPRGEGLTPAGTPSDGDPSPPDDAAPSGPPGPTAGGGPAARAEDRDAAAGAPQDPGGEPDRPAEDATGRGSITDLRDPKAGPRGAGARGRLRPVPVAGAAAGRSGGLRAWRTRPWALLMGVAAAAVLAVTALQVRPATDDDPKEAAASPAPSSAASGSAPTAGPTARGEPKKDDDDTAKERASASPRGDGRRGDGASASASPEREGSGSGGSGGGGRDDKPGGGTPLTLSTRSHVWENRCDHRYLIDRPPSQVAPPPVEQDAAAWASAHGAVHGGTTNVEVTVKGRSESAVVLQDLHVRVVGRRAPLPWSSFAMENGCGGSLTPRAFSVDLDADRPLPIPTDGSDAGEPIPAVRFPYRVSATDPEVLLVNARTSGCDCSWYLELDWTSGDREGTIRIDEHGAPFRTSGVKGRPEYGYQYDEGVWRRND
ncbi:helix-turn-helix transcriptional regulator [Streptomyces sparsogenes]|uniref:helix-turn-helix domain-containing protein n=1 Tax=Streptomyces sparsogenes TaxID=67365 RepID=UPI003406AE99